MVRKNHHAYHDFSDKGDVIDDSSLASLPDQQFMEARLAQANSSKSTLEEQQQQPPMTPNNQARRPTSVDQIPSPALPSTLSIGGYRREPIPAVPEERDLAQVAVQESINGVFATFQHACPPPADTQYEVEDQGVSGPEFFRVSMYNVPVDEKLRQSTQLPLASYLRPFARDEVPLADFSAYDGESMPPRCRRCRAYMNPSMRFTHGGGKFVCNLCLFENPTPAEYFQPTNHENKRIDWAERPELAFGTYDFIVSKHPDTNENDVDAEDPSAPKLDTGSHMYGDDAYDKGQGTAGSVYGKPEEPFVHVFCCEVSRDGMQKGSVASFLTGVRESSPYMKPGTKIAFITFDSKITCYRASMNGPEMLVGSPNFMAIPPDVLLDPATQQTEIYQVLDLISTAFMASTDRNSCLADALKSLKDMAHYSSGGRVTVLATSLPSIGSSKLVARDRALAGVSPDNDTPMQQQLFNPTSRTYIDLGVDSANNGWGCDMSVVPTSSFNDMASLNYLSQRTGGKLLYYPRFSADRDGRRIVADSMTITALPVQARQIQMKIRTSTGSQSSSKFKDAAMDWGFMDSDSTLIATCDYDGRSNPSMDTHFQAAILYTTETGEKRVRVCNQLVGVNAKVKSISKLVDVDVITMAIIRQTLGQLGEHPTAELRAAVSKKLQDIFAAVRKLVGYGVPESQLLMPINSRVLPMYMLSFTKSIVSGSRPFSSDARVASAAWSGSVDPTKLSLSLYPRIYAVDTEKISTKVARFDEIVNSPVPVLVFDGQQFYLWLSSAMPPSVIESLFGVQDSAEVSPWSDEMPQIEGASADEDSLSSRITRLVAQEAQRVGRSWLPLQIVRQSMDGSEFQSRQLMVEDTYGDSPSYMNYIVKVHDFAKNASKERTSTWF